jgi:class 3 adenylate cyclase
MESSVAKPGQIVLTEFTRAHLGDEFIVNSIGFQRPKGISRDIEVFELVGVKA